MDCITRFLLIVGILIAPTFYCEEATVNTLEVVSGDGTNQQAREQIYVPPLSLDVEPFPMRLNLAKMSPVAEEPSINIASHRQLTRSQVLHLWTSDPVEDFAYNELVLKVKIADINSDNMQT